MGVVSLPNLDAIMQIQDPDQRFEALVNTVGILIKNLSEINGYMNSKNLFEAGGWLVKSTELASKAGDVGMSSEATAADDVRFWSGGTNKNTAPWRVTESGKMTATGALIQSADGSYPRVVMDPDGDLFGAYKDSTDYIEIDSDYVGSPSINIYEDGAIRGQISSLSLKLRLASSSDLDLVSSSGDVVVSPASGKHLRVGTFARIYGTSEGKDLLTALGEKVNTTTAFSTYGVNMTFDNTTRNLKLFAGDGSQIAIVNIP